MGLVVARDRKLYGNYQVFSPDDKLMFRCDSKKANWYLERELADIIDGDPLKIKLKFQPNGLGSHNREYGLDEMENICVVCGSDEFLTRHHVVPFCYRVHFPESEKSHKFHDVLSVCVTCHENYEKKAFELKLKIADEYSANICGELINNKDILKIRRLSFCLKGDISVNIPRKRIFEIKNTIKDHFGWKRLSKKRIDHLINIEVKVYTRTHGEVVVSKLTDIKSFIRMWRSHFVENTECKFLPKNWSIDNE